MLAHHPETGQPIRILRSDAQITQSRRTLVWLQAGYIPSERWQRWSILLTDPLSWIQNMPITAIILTNFQEAWIPILKEVEESALIVCKKGHEEFRKAGFAIDNWLTYEDLFQMYPFLGEPVKQSDPLEKVVVSVAHILRFPYLAWTPNNPLSSFQAQIYAWQRTCAGQFQVLPADAAAEVVPECWLIQQYFQHKVPRRAREIATCLEKNLANPFIDRILLLNERKEELPKSEKIVEKVIGRRMTYKDVLDAIRTEVPAGAFVVFSNSDIWCDGSLKALWTIPLVERRLFLALLRWEDKGHGEEPDIFGPRPDSQDTWIVAKETVDFIPTEEEFGFPFGKPGCDNAISVAMLKHKCLVVNPAYSVKTYHLHNTNIRDYNPRDVLYKPVYLYMDPTPIQMFSVEKHMKAWEKTALRRQGASFSRRIYGSDAHVTKVLRMIQDLEGETFQKDAANTWTPTSVPVYELKNAFVSDTGLLSNFQSIFVGSHEGWQKGWQQSTLSTITTTIHVPAMITVGNVGESCWKSLASWCLEYLPKVLQLRKQMGSEYEFLVPTLPEVPPFLYDCIWTDNQISTIPHIPNTQYYCNRLLALPPADSLSRMTKEDVDALREMLPKAKTTGTLVVCLDDLFTEGWLEEWRTCHASILKAIRIVAVKAQDVTKLRQAFQGADWILGRCEALRWIWMAPKGTRILEWMLETEVSSEILHLAGAAECKYIVSLLPKDPVEFRQQAILQFGSLWREYGFKELVEAVEEKPILHLPAGKALQGIYHHTGDSFREMVRFWAEKGYCAVKETEDSPFVWWGDVGDVLLYDWDTPRWLYPSMNYAFALFGNCTPPNPEGHRQSVWGFWGCHPKALEAAVDQGLLGWSERIICSLFLGKVENGVQKARRCNEDWNSAVELFSMPVDTIGAPYPYTQSEYLEKLRHAKFGLCLPGYGHKCNREIEYMAFGVVPIVTPGVDISGYLVAPQEGVHYLCAATPSDVLRIVAETTEETWMRMSDACHRWWRENASAEGLFRLTWGRIEQCRPFQGLMLPTWPPK